MHSIPLWSVDQPVTATRVSRCPHSAQTARPVQPRDGGWALLLSATVLVLVLFASLPALAAAEEYAAGEVLIRFRETTSEAAIKAFEQAENLSLLNEIKSIRVRNYALPADADVQDAVTRFKGNAIVEFAEPNFLRASSAVDDPSYGSQWFLHNTGQRVNGVAGPAGIDIRWPEAMAIFQGAAPVVVAVIDSGVAIDHKELLPTLHTNEAELSGQVGIDDDRNGFIDDFAGYDFFARDQLALDEFGHGTLVASVIAAEANNQLGVTGVSPHAKIMPLRVLNQFGRAGVPRFARVSDLALAMEYAALGGARIVNLSLGGPAFSATELLILRELDRYHVLVVAAAGNGGADLLGDDNDFTPTYPASYDVGNIIAVAAQDRSGGLASFSNYGAKRVHIAAPGTQIYGADLTRKVIFAENFQGSVPGWTVGSAAGNISSYAWAISSDGALIDRLYGGTYLPLTNTWVRSPLINLAGSIGTRLTFDVDFDLADDFIWIEASADGVNWEPFSFVVGSSSFNWMTYSVDCSDFDGLSGYFRFRLQSNLLSNGLGVVIDNISLSSVSLFDAGTPRFQFSDGTSFSAPIVAGVASLVMSQRPDLSAHKVRSIVLDSARPMSGLSGKVSTSGMIDAERALQLANAASVVDAPVISVQPSDQSPAAGGTAVLVSAVSSPIGATAQWHRNGSVVFGALGATLALANMEPAQTGLYTAIYSGASARAATSTAIVGLSTTAKVLGAGREVGSNIFVAANGRTFDQVLLEGRAAAITADYSPDPNLNQITRMSFIDLTGDIVQVEYSGPGTLSLVLEGANGPAPPAKYNQSTNYMTGTAGIVITGATQDSNVSVFTVGRSTAVNQALFKTNVSYDGIANIAFIAISSSNGRFGGVRTANASYFASHGFTGLYAPGVTFEGPVYLGDVAAFESAISVIMLGGAIGNTWITGGSLSQPNGRVVLVSGLTQLAFKAGSDSHGNLIPAKQNQGVIWQNGADATTSIVVNP